MKLAKAIEIARTHPVPQVTASDHDFRDAVLLLIEAGERLQKTRKWSPLFGQPLLPGETID